jgi:hypothetical protein
MFSTAVRGRLRRSTPQGASADELDRMVRELADLDDDERSAAWLYAWQVARNLVETGRRERALELLGSGGGRGPS